MALPSNVSYGTVVGRFMRAVADGPDPDRDPDGIPLEGLTLRFQPSATVFKNLTAAPPVTIIADTIQATTDADGYVIGPDGGRGVRLLATDDPDLDPTGWTWRVTVSGPSIQSMSLSFLLPADATVDLTSVVPVPSNPGSSLPQWEVAVAATEAARDEAVLARDEAVAAAEAAEAAQAEMATKGRVISSPTKPPVEANALWVDTGDGNKPHQGVDLGSEPATNLATNPSFETGGAVVEVRRNLLLNPQMLTATDWDPGAGVTITPTSAGLQVDTTADQAVGASMVYNNAQIPVAESESLIGAFTEVTVPVGYPALTFKALQRIYGTTVVDAGGPTITVGPGETKAIPAAAATAISGSTDSRLIITPSESSIPVGARFILRNAIVEKSTIPGPYFDGGYSPDPDLTPTWVGAVGASASVLRATPVSGSSLNPSNNANVFQSSQWASTGARSLRISPVGSGSMTYATAVPTGFTAGRTYTIMAKVRLEEAQSGTLHGRARSIYTGFDTANFAQAPNEAGVHEVRITVTAKSGGTTLVLYNGSTSTDVWWDDLCIVEGNYEGPFFDGGMLGCSWEGTPGASPSVYLGPSWVEVRDRGIVDLEARLLTGTGSPEGVVAARVGTLYTRTDGTPGATLYVKESGTGTTGWAAK